MPRDVLVRLAALSRQIGTLRQEQAEHVELLRCLDDISTGLGAVIQSIFDDTADHLTGRRL